METGRALFSDAWRGWPCGPAGSMECFHWDPSALMKLLKVTPCNEQQKQANDTSTPPPFCPADQAEVCVFTSPPLLGHGMSAEGPQCGSMEWRVRQLGCGIPCRHTSLTGGSTQSLHTRRPSQQTARTQGDSLLPKGLPVGPPAACVPSVPPLDCKRPEVSLPVCLVISGSPVRGKDQ